MNAENTAMTARTRRTLWCIILAFCLCGALLVPSGGLLAGTGAGDTLDAAGDMRTGAEAALSNIVGGALGLPKVYPLPMSETGGSTPDPDGWSDYTDADGNAHRAYDDPTISVDCWSEYIPLGGESCEVYFSRVKISHPTQLRTAQAGGGYSSSSRHTCSGLAEQVNAIVAINGDMFNYFDDGIIVRQGSLFRSVPTEKEQLFVDSAGDFRIIDGVSAENEGFTSDAKIYNSFQFGPALVVDGEPRSFERGDGTALPRDFEYNPRTAIGQLGPLEYLLVAVEGRTERSRGVFTQDLVPLMLGRGCVQAYNLDGGQSSTMFFRDGVFNTVSNGGERPLSEIIYFCSSRPEE